MKDAYRKPVLITACILLGIGAVAMIVGIFVKDAGNWLAWVGAGFLVISMLGNAVVVLDKDDVSAAPVAPVAPAPVTAVPVAKAPVAKAPAAKAAPAKAPAAPKTTTKKA